jgi:hypothetical protein
MEKCTLINVEIDGKLISAKVSIEELISRAEATGYAWTDIEEALKDAEDGRIDDEYHNRGLDKDINFTETTYLEILINDLYTEIICERDPKEQLNNLFREFLNREI